ncbi:MAG: ABC transporter permease [Gemmatimonadota bacterium]
MSLRRLGAIARKEIIQLRRDPRSVSLAFALPLALVLIFGYAITLDVKHIGLSVLDQDRSPESRRLVDAFERSGYFEIRTPLAATREIDEVLDRGRAALVLVVPPGFARELGSGGPGTVQLLLDGSDANTAEIALNYAEAIAAAFPARLTVTAGRQGADPGPRSRVWYNEALDSQSMIVPGLIAVIMSIIAAMLTSLTIAREWERGTMEQLAATPVHRLEVIFGKLLPYLAIGLIDVAITCLVSLGVFGVPLRGSVTLLFATSILFLLGALGFGIFVSAAVKSQLLASQMALMSTYLPALLLSGFIFAIANMPTVLRIVSYIIPARYFVTVTRGIFLKGIGLETLWLPALGLTLFSVVGIGLATASFRKEIA